MPDLILADLAAVLTSVFDTLQPLLNRTLELFSRPGIGAAQLVSVDGPAIDALRRPDDLIVGAGFVVAPGALIDEKYWLRWWSDYNTPRTGRPELLAVETDPRSETFNDYTRLPWYSVPEQSRQRHVTGPYVDYLCTDEYTLTYTIPVITGDRFLGVVGADVYARDMLSQVGRLLDDADGIATTLLNARGRVLAASGTDRDTGDLVRDEGVLPALCQLMDGSDVSISGRFGRLDRIADLPIALLRDAGDVMS